MKTNPFERSGSTLSFKNIWAFDQYTFSLGLEASSIDEGSLSSWLNRRLRTASREHIVDYTRVKTHAIK